MTRLTGFLFGIGSLKILNLKSCQSRHPVYRQIQVYNLKLLQLEPWLQSNVASGHWRDTNYLQINSVFPVEFCNIPISAKQGMS
jgi:hypothetical protein